MGRPQGFRVQGGRLWVLAFRVQGLGFRAQGLGFKRKGAGSSAQGLGLRVQRLELSTEGLPKFRHVGPWYGPITFGRCSSTTV